MGGSFFIRDALVGHIEIVGRRPVLIGSLLIVVEPLLLVPQEIVLEGD